MIPISTVITVQSASGEAIIDIGKVAAVGLADNVEYGVHTEIHMQSGTIFSVIGYKGMAYYQAHEQILAQMKKLGWG